MVQAAQGDAGQLIVEFEKPEHEILVRLVGEFRDLLISSSNTDPVLQRLFPEPFEEADKNESWRALVGSDLLATKRANLELAAGWLASPTLRLEEPGFDVWISFLTDLRLSIATRIGADAELLEAELSPADPRAPALALFHWLGYVLELSLEIIAVS